MNCRDQSNIFYYFSETILVSPLDEFPHHATFFYSALCVRSIPILLICALNYINKCHIHWPIHDLNWLQCITNILQSITVLYTDTYCGKIQLHLPKKIRFLHHLYRRSVWSADSFDLFAKTSLITADSKSLPTCPRESSMGHYFCRLTDFSLLFFAKIIWIMECGSYNNSTVCLWKKICLWLFQVGQ